MSITLPREQQEWLETQVKPGVHASIDDAVARIAAEHVQLDPGVGHDIRRIPGTNDGALRQA